MATGPILATSTEPERRLLRRRQSPEQTGATVESGAASGRRSVKTVSPGSLRTVIEPPCAVMIARTIARPRPLEPAARDH
ncbi:hypothetical protein, partial [Burkholderia cenocepacia]